MFLKRNRQPTGCQPTWPSGHQPTCLQLAVNHLVGGLQLAVNQLVGGLQGPTPTAADRPADRPPPQKTTLGEVKTFSNKLFFRL